MKIMHFLEHLTLLIYFFTKISGFDIIKDGFGVATLQVCLYEKFCTDGVKQLSWA